MTPRAYPTITDDEIHESLQGSQIYGASVAKETVSRITEKVAAEMNDWANRLWRGSPAYVAQYVDLQRYALHDHFRAIVRRVVSAQLPPRTPALSIRGRVIT